MDFMQMRALLCNLEGSLDSLQTYVMLFILVWIFLRRGECGSMTQENFIESLHMLYMHKEIPKGLCAKIKGKTDKTFIFLYLFANNMPELCPLHHLLMNVHAIKWKGDNLFPTVEEL